MFEKFYSLFGTKLIHDDVAVLVLYFETQTLKLKYLTVIYINYMLII